MGLVKLTQGDIEKIQIDEGIVVVNFGKATHRIIGPTRGGATATITPSIRDIDHDGRRGKEKNLQVKDGEDASITVATICSSQENLALALPGAVVGADTGKTIKPSKFGLIPASAYLDNIAIVTKMADGTFKVLIIYNAMHEGAFTLKAASKAENEHNLELQAHYDPTVAEDEFDLYEIKDSATNPLVTTQASNQANNQETNP